MTGKALVELIERKRASYDSEFDGEVPFTNDEAETLFREIERLQALAQAAGYTGDDRVAEALRAIPVMRDAASRGLPYIRDEMMLDGGLDECDICTRFDFEQVSQALANGGPHDRG